MALNGSQLSSIFNKLQPPPPSTNYTGSGTGYSQGPAFTGGSTLGHRAQASTIGAGNAANSMYGQYSDLLNNGQSDLNQYASSAMSAAMPQFNQAMQGVQESEVARGTGTGGVGTAAEGSLQSAFQRNIANAVGQQSMNLYGQQLGQSGDMFNNLFNDYNQNMWTQRQYGLAQQNANMGPLNALLGGVGEAAGMALHV